MNPFGIDVADLTFHYERHSQNVVDHVSFRIEPGAITGLLGRNGSGKSTVGMLMAGLLYPTSGSVRANGQHVYENPGLMANVCYVSDSTPILEDEKTRRTLELWEASRPNWDRDYANELIEAFRIDVKKKPSRLSRGQLSSLYALLGLASRCPVTVFDEVHLGMDAVAREIFYASLLADYTKHPRTLVLSSHLIEEVESLLDSVIFMDNGRVVESGDADDVRSRHSDGGELAHLTDVLMKMALSSNTAAAYRILQKGRDHE